MIYYSFRKLLALVLAGFAITTVGCNQSDLKKAEPNAATNEVTNLSNSRSIGGSDGGGGDTVHPWTHSAWFVGRDKTVNICYEAASDFGVSSSEIENQITSAYEIWDTYIIERFVNQLTGDVRPNLPTQIKILKQCGSEDLKFYFGKSGRDVTDAAKDFNNPLAFAYRTSYEDSNWGKGFVWIGNNDKAKELLGGDWQTNDLLQGMILHEVGHILGCDHVGGTLMREEIVEFMKSSIKEKPEYRKVMMTSIDWDDDLLPANFRYDYLGEYIWGFNEEGNNNPTVGDGKSIYEDFLGRPAVGDMYTRLYRKDGSSEIHLVFTDKKGSTDLLIEDWSHIGDVTRQGSIFHIYNPNYNPDDDILNTNLRDYGVSIPIVTGTLTARSGQKFPILLQEGGAVPCVGWGGVCGGWVITTTGHQTLFKKRLGNFAKAQ